MASDIHLNISAVALLTITIFFEINQLLPVEWKQKKKSVGQYPVNGVILLYRGSPVQHPKWSQIDPEMIPISLQVDPEMIRNYFLEWNGIPPRNYSKSVAVFTLLKRIKHFTTVYMIFSAFVV